MEDQEKQPSQEPEAESSKPEEQSSGNDAPARGTEKSAPDAPFTSPDAPASSGLDLADLQSLSIGPDWSAPGFKEKKPSSRDYPEERSRGRGGSRPDRRGGSHQRGGGGGGPRPGGGPRQGGGGPRSGGGPRPGGGGPRPGGDRRDDRGGRGRQDRGGHRDARPAPFRPSVDVSFFPEDAPFRALTKAIRQSCRTFELFEIANLILQKPDRFVVVVKPLEDKNVEEQAPLFYSVPDGLPFASEEDAISHVMESHLDQFFNRESVEVEPPKGNFLMVNKCTLTGELLGPPNYHRYQQIAREHHTQNVGKMSFERYMESKIESVKDADVVQQWLQKMTTQTRFVLKASEEGQEPKVFDSLDSARHHLMVHCREELARPSFSVRFSGKDIDKLPAGPIQRSIEFALEDQRRFPLSTANHVRGRLRRLNFSIYKKGSKGVSFVCGVKRRFRSPNQVFSDSLQELIIFIDAHPEINAAELPEKFLGIRVEKPAEAPAESKTEAAPAETPADTQTATPATETPDAESTPTEGETPATDSPATDSPATEAPPADDTPAPSAPAAKATPEEDPRMRELSQDLRWLVSEGYVVEYADGRLTAVPPLEQPKPKAEKPTAATSAPEANAESRAAPAGDSEANTTPNAEAPAPSEPEPSAPATETPAAETPATEPAEPSDESPAATEAERPAEAATEPAPAAEEPPAAADDSPAPDADEKPAGS